MAALFVDGKVFTFISLFFWNDLLWIAPLFYGKGFQFLFVFFVWKDFPWIPALFVDGKVLSFVS